ncbi:hypothetical protein [Burkholderia ambifaria]|uniref:hypothetical protein n=1 Tax=Burkholderia ambifaria TaxID=152480 RepID=UPI0012FE57B1|nr:hypothetical protein [Burkholderia ambifaria]
MKTRFGGFFYDRFLRGRNGLGRRRRYVVGSTVGFGSTPAVPVDTTVCPGVSAARVTRVISAMRAKIDNPSRLHGAISDNR